MFSDGMRIFESFGPHILRFALSLELDESILANPPTKPLQEVIPTFWGVYRWPHQNYHRYSDLEGLEQAADETQSMKKALQCLEKVTTLGLCCDAGLGFLYGPDIEARARASKSRVFSKRCSPSDDYAHDDLLGDSVSSSAYSSADSSADAPGDDFGDDSNSQMNTAANNKRMRLEGMAREAGYAGEQLSEVIDLLLTTEGIGLIEPDPVEVPKMPKQSASPIPWPGNRTPWADDPTESATSFTPSAHHPLNPTDLTMAQKEFLLELEWAHRALIQSYVIGLTDSAVEGRFQHLTTLNLAKIPSTHLTILQNEDFWESFPSLENVSLGVVADWRRIVKSHPGSILDIQISPVGAVSAAFVILNDYIGKCAKIENIHFEWICGGEFASGSHQRNQYILPAPFTKSSDGMGNPFAAMDEEIISLPHVKHLSLKNCWLSPHVMLQSLRQMSLSSLETLELESVSLSGPPTLTPSVAVPAVQGGFNTGFNGFHPHSPPTFHNFPNGPLAATEHPWSSSNILSWSGMLNHFSVSPTLLDPEFSPLAAESILEKIERFIPSAAELPHDKASYMLKSITLTSCGYVTVDAPFLNSRALSAWHDPFATLQGNSVMANQSQELSGRMQACKDKMVGRLLPHMQSGEKYALVQVFGMVLGWEGVYDKETIDAAHLDGYEFPGLGRFSGTVRETNDDFSWFRNT